MPDKGSKSFNLWNIVFHWLLFAEKGPHPSNVLIGEKTMDGRYSVDIESSNKLHQQHKVGENNYDDD